MQNLVELDMILYVKTGTDGASAEVCVCTGRGERGGGGAFLLRGVVPPCIDEVADGVC